MRAYHSNPLLCFLISWKTTSGQEKKAFWLQSGTAASSHDLSSKFKENTEWNKASEETTAASNTENFSFGRQLKPQPTTSLESQRLCTPHPGFPSPWINAPCIISVQRFASSLLFRSTTTKNCLSPPQSCKAGGRMAKLMFARPSESIDVTSKGTSGSFCSGLPCIAIKEEAEIRIFWVLEWRGAVSV